MQEVLPEPSGNVGFDIVAGDSASIAMLVLDGEQTAKWARSCQIYKSYFMIHWRYSMEMPREPKHSTLVWEKGREVSWWWFFFCFIREMDLSSRKRDILKEQWLSIAWRGLEVGGGMREVVTRISEGMEGDQSSSTKYAGRMKEIDSQFIADWEGNHDNIRQNNERID